LTHPSIASQGSIKLGIFHERNFGKLPSAKERMPPAEDPVIAERKAEDMNAHIPK